MKRILIISLFIVCIALLFLLVWPSPIAAVAWLPEENEGFTGQFEQNERLDAMQFLVKNECVGCEAPVISPDGRFIYAGESDGDILRFGLDGDSATLIGNTGGRPLGMHFSPEGDLIIADAQRGLLRCALASGDIEILTTNYQDLKFGFVDDLDIDSTGLIYFTDASSKYGYDQVIEDLMEHQPHGALYSYEPATRTTTLLLDNLYFANGVALAEDESYLLFNETGDYSVSKYWLKGAKKGQREYVLKNLPGFPDNIRAGGDGVFWLTLVSPRDESLDKLMPKPAIRNLIMKLPKSLQPAATHYACVIGITDDGSVKYNFQSSNPKFIEITCVQPHKDRLYFGSLVDTGIAFLDL